MTCIGWPADSGWADEVAAALRGETSSAQSRDD